MALWMGWFGWDYSQQFSMKFGNQNIILCWPLKTISMQSALLELISYFDPCHSQLLSSSWLSAYREMLKEIPTSFLSSSKTYELLKSPLDQNPIVIYYTSNNDFKSHINFKKTQKRHKYFF
jgi:hypothetical protein